MRGVTGATGATGSTGPAPAGNAGDLVYLQSTGVAAAATASHWDDTNGRLGIGTASPGYKLDVSGGDIYTQNGGNFGSAGGSINFAANAGAGPMAQIKGALESFAGSVNDQGHMAFLTRPHELNPYTVRTSLTERMRITSAGRVGIGTTTPQFLLSSEQDISATADIQPNTAQFAVMGSTISGKRMVFGYDTQTAGNGHGFIKAGYLGMGWTNLCLQPNGGNVGIGTTTPGSALEVNGVMRFTGTSTSLTGINLPAGGAGIHWGNGYSRILDDGDLRICTDDNMHFYTGCNASSLGTERITLLVGGNVGIGTTSPATTLDVNGTITTPGFINVTTSDPGDLISKRYASADRYGIGQYTSGVTRVFTSGTYAGSVRISRAADDLRTGSATFTDLMTVLSTGNVGIGTTSPGSALSFGNPVVNKIITLYDGNAADPVSTATNFYGFGVNGSTLRYQVDSTGALHRFYCGTTLAATFAVTIYKLEVNGNDYASGRRYTSDYFSNFGSGGLYNDTYGNSLLRNDAYYGNWKIDSGNAFNGWHGIRFTGTELNLLMGETNGIKHSGIHMNGTGWSFYSDNNRNFFVPGTITSNWSDRRLKKDFVQVEDYDEILNGMTAYRFKWNALGEKVTAGAVKENVPNLSLIAQDVQAVLPNAVKVNKAGLSPDSTKNDVFDYLTIDYDKITPVLVEALKQTRKELAETRERLFALEKIVNRQ